MDPAKFNSSPSAFFLVGIPGLESAYPWMGTLFCAMYLMALAGNCALLLTIRLAHTLHHPMFYFLAMLGMVDLVMASSVVPKMLGIFWSGSREIGFDACFAQMFLVHSTTAVESGVLLAMAFDRYIAICHPLSYEVILTSQRVVQIGLAVLARGIVYMAPLTWMLRSLPYCASQVIPHSYCEHMVVMKLACADHSASSTYNLVGTTLIVGTDTTLIALSYRLILRVVGNLAEKTERLKAFSTCSSHICVMLLYYLPGLVSIYIQCFPMAVPPQLQVLLADLYLSLPPMLNPIIYSIRTKQVREALGKAFPFFRSRLR